MSLELSTEISVFFIKSLNLPTAPVADIKKRFVNVDNVSLRFDMSLDLVKKRIESGACAIVVFTITNKKELADYFAFLQETAPALKSRSVITAVFASNMPDRVQAVLLKSRCEEVFPFSLPSKALTLKVKRYIRSIETRSSVASDQIHIVIPGASVDVSKGPANKNRANIVLLESLNAKEDFWLIGSLSHIKTIKNFWFIEMMGPSPSAGIWEAVDEKSLSAKEHLVWEWSAKKDHSYFDTGELKWRFNGKKPYYNSAINRWSFSSANPQLALVSDQEEQIRFKLGWSDEIRVTKNSPDAEAVFVELKKTFHLSVAFEKDQAVEIPWSDFTNSNDLPMDWMSHGLGSEQNDLLWLNKVGSADVNSIPGVQILSEDFYTEIDSALGLDAVRPCNVRGQIKGKRVEINGYTDEGFLVVDLPNDLVVSGETVSVEVKEEKVGKIQNREVHCLVDGIVEKGSGRSVAKILLQDQSAQFFDDIERMSVEKQAELSMFFIQSKGIGPASAHVTTQDEAMLKAFLSDKRILILDSQATTRQNLASNLVKFGAIRAYISFASSLEEAKKASEHIQQEIIFSDFWLGRDSGFDFIREQKVSFEKVGLKNGLFFLITANTSQSAAAKAAEEDIDQFILKPFSHNSLKLLVIDAIKNKIAPNPFMLMIQKSEAMISEGNLDEAEELLLKALNEDANLSLAYFHLAQIQVKKGDAQQAEDFYNEGLDLNKIHYKCLSGLHELLWSQNRHQEAYDIMKKIVLYFPANSERLSNTLRDAIITDSFKDMAGYYQTFLDIDVKSEEVIHYICSALVVAGKHYLKKKDLKRALEHFELARLTSSHRSKFGLYIIESLLAYQFVDESTQFLLHLQTNSPDSEDYQAAKFLCAVRTLPAIDAIQLGREIIAAGVCVMSVYEKMITLSLDEGYPESAGELFEQACKFWPDERARFTALLDGPALAAG